MYRALEVARKLPDGEKRAREVRKILSSSFEKRQELLAQHQDNPPGTPWQHVMVTGHMPPSPQEKHEQVLDWFFFKRNRTPRWVAQEKEKEGDLKAHKQLVRANDEFWRLCNGHGSVTPFKVDQAHTDLLELGLHLGLKVLSAEELADCFDEVCACGRSHDADALKKQRSRVLKDLEIALQEGSRYWVRKPSWERFEVYGANGFIAKGYSPRDGRKYVEISRRGTGFECIVQEDGSFAGSKKDTEIRDVLLQIPAAFFMPTAEQLFEMFFPKGNKNR